jgi:hypothetical protein
MCWPLEGSLADILSLKVQGELSCCGYLQQGVAVVARALSHSNGPTGIRHLELNACGVEPETLPKLSAISSLETLSILGNSLADKCLDILGKLLCKVSTNADPSQHASPEGLDTTNLSENTDGKETEGTSGASAENEIREMQPFLGLRSLNISGNGLTGAPAGVWLLALARGHALVRSALASSITVAALIIEPPRIFFCGEKTRELLILLCFPPTKC